MFRSDEKKVLRRKRGDAFPPLNITIEAEGEETVIEIYEGSDGGFSESTRNALHLEFISRCFELRSIA